MKARTVVLLVAAVVIGTAGSRMSKRLFSGPPAPEPIVENVSVLIAKQPLPAETVLREPERMFEERALPKNEAPANAVVRLYQLRGRRLARAIEANTIITVDALVNEFVERTESLKKEGRQAVAVSVQSLGNYVLLPQSRIDLIWTRKAGGIAESRVIAQDLPLLGVQSKAGGAIVTVAAKRDDVEKLSQATTQGSLKLVLRAAKQ